MPFSLILLVLMLPASSVPVRVSMYSPSVNLDVLIPQLLLRLLVEPVTAPKSCISLVPYFWMVRSSLLNVMLSVPDAVIVVSAIAVVSVPGDVKIAVGATLSILCPMQVL